VTQAPIATLRAPASAAFYAGCVTASGAVEELTDAAAAAAFVAEHPGAHLVVDARFEAPVTAGLPANYGVLRTASSFPTAKRVLLLGPKPLQPPARLAAEPGTASSPH
jgi:hypothetical protein